MKVIGDESTNRSWVQNTSFPKNTCTDFVQILMKGEDKMQNHK